MKNNLIKAPFSIENTKTIQISIYNNGEHSLEVCPEIIYSIFKLLPDNSLFSINWVLSVDHKKEELSDDLIISSEMSADILIKILNKDLMNIEKKLDLDTEGVVVYLILSKILIKS
jgi:hypothetical protein